MKKSVRQRILSLVLYLCLALLLAYVLFTKHATTLEVGTKAPIEDLIRLQNGPVSFARLTKKVTVINFWASWCHPCLSELPILKDAAQRYSQVAFVGPLVGSNESLAELKSSFQIPYTIGHVDNNVSTQWHAQFLPTTYILDSFGQILWAKAGAVDAAEFEQALKAAIKSTERKF